MAHLKGHNVNLFLNRGAGFSVVAASTSCDFNITANTADASAKDDPGKGEWDNQEFQNYSWSCSNESFLVDATYLQALLDLVVNGTAQVGVRFEHSTATGDNVFKKKGTAIITSLEVTAANGDFVKVNISLDGNSTIEPLTSSDQAITISDNTSAKIKGKALMVAIKGGSTYYTLACATSHKLSVSLQTGDVTDKDMNDNFVAKEVTDRSITLSTENLIDAANSDVCGKGINDIFSAITAGTALTLAFGYYPSAVGASHHGGSNGWGSPNTVLVEGSFLCTSLNQSAQNKSDYTWSAEFASKGKPTVSSVNGTSQLTPQTPLSDNADA